MYRRMVNGGRVALELSEHGGHEVHELGAVLKAAGAAGGDVFHPTAAFGAGGAFSLKLDDESVVCRKARSIGVVHARVSSKARRSKSSRFLHVTYTFAR